jgi:predicted Zn finger-like uncharacterized protein
MIVRCSQCQQLLRVDENNLPEGRSVKVRCPHCNVIGQMSGRQSEAITAAGDHSETAVPETDYPLLLRVDGPPAPAAASTAEWHDSSLPSDAFQSFRFPAEREKREAATKQKRSTVKYVLWAIGSLAVIGFFALLVNIVLPGPGGVRPAIHTVPPHEGNSARVPKQVPQMPPGSTEEDVSQDQ